MNMRVSVLSIALACVNMPAVAAEVYSAKSSLQNLDVHDNLDTPKPKDKWFPHKHTRSHLHPNQWRTLAAMNVDNVSPGDVWDIVAEADIRYHQAPTLSVSLMVVACVVNTESLGPEAEAFVQCNDTLPRSIQWIKGKGRYSSVVRSGHWVVPAGATSRLRVFLKARFLSIPRAGKQGHKVFMAPRGQWMSVAVHK